MKSKIGFIILDFVILICVLGLEFCILFSNSRSESTKYETEIEIQKSNSNVSILEMAPIYKIEIGKMPIEIETKEEKMTFFELSDEDRDIICYIVAGEAKGESMEGKMAVAQCLLNAMVKEQKSAYEIKIMYKYSGWDSELQNSNPDLWAEVEEAVSRVFDDGEFISENPILFFYAPKYAKGKWHETLPYDQTIGGHKFFYLEEDVTADWFLNLKGEN